MKVKSRILLLLVEYGFFTATSKRYRSPFLYCYHFKEACITQGSNSEKNSANWPQLYHFFSVPFFHRVSCFHLFWLRAKPIINFILMDDIQIVFYWVQVIVGVSEMEEIHLFTPAQIHNGISSHDKNRSDFAWIN